MISKKSITLQKVLPWLLIVGGIVGLICSFILTYDQVKIWQDPSYQPACSLNPVVSCGDVINSKTGDIFGLPSPLFGLAVFPALITFGIIVQSGAKLKRWLWQGLQIGMLGGLIWALVLFFISIYKVHALCPFCLTVDAVIYILFWYTTLYSFETGIIHLPKGKLEKAGRFARQHHLDIIVFWFLLVTAYTLHHFWYYYGKYL